MTSIESLPNRFPHQQAQQRVYQMWEEGGYFHADPDPERKPYTIVIPPPNVTGALHLGHALNNTLQDVMVRLRRMQGFCTLWMPGTDHAGIATQAVVERRLREEEQKSRHDLGREALVDRIWKWKDQYEQRILNQLKKMGASCDWRRTRFTLDETCARAVRYTFFDLFSKQLIYRGKRLVNWDTFLQTAVSDDEVSHETIQGHFWHFRYPVIDPQQGEPTSVTIATTRPETMLGDSAVAVHPNPSAALAELETTLREKLAEAPAKDRVAIQAELERIEQRRTEMLPQLEQLRDMAQRGCRLNLPLLNREIPLVCDEWAKPELGSGCVKITPAHDPNDYEVGLRQDLPMINILNPDGILNENAGPYAGLPIPQARKRVVADLEAEGLLGDIEDREIELAHSDRSKTPIEPYLADQWFVKMDQLAQSAMDAVSDGRVTITPTRYSKGYLDWLSEKRDWPVSRQLWWGHQIPIWSRTLDGQSADDLLAKLQAAGTDQGLAWHLESSPAGNDELRICIREEGSPLEAVAEELGFVREEDVLDTWFSSALWPHSTLGWPTQTAELEYFYPTSTLITSRDIITLWVARMVLMGLNNMGDVPFRDVYIHPKILDGYGETMSKSKGNGVDPLDVIDKFGADALRFGLTRLTTETQDVRMPVQFECPHCEALIEQTKKIRELPRVTCPKCHQEFRTQWAREEDQELKRGPVVSERFEVARNFANKLWNASRFVMLSLEGYQAAPVAQDELAFEDRWILSRLTTVSQQVTTELDAFHFSEAARVVYDFAWDEFCSFYIEMIKDRFQDPARAPVAQRVAAFALDVILRLIHPIMPFITEEIWQLLAGIAPDRGLEQPQRAVASIMVADWPQVDPCWQDAEIEAQFGRFHEVLSAVREIRSRQNIAPRESVEFCVRCQADVAAQLRLMQPYFTALAKASATRWGPDVEPPATNARVQVDEAEVFLDLAGFIDVDAEIERNEKQHSKLLQMITGKEKKLANDKFVQNAPGDVVQRERESLSQLHEQLASVEEALANLRASR